MKITIHMDAKFGSPFQEEVLLQSLRTMMIAYQMSAGEHHKKNRIAYHIDIQNAKEVI